MDAIKGKGENSTYDGAEVAKQCHQDYSGRHLIWPIPVAQLQEDARPETSLEKAQKCTDSV